MRYSKQRETILKVVQNSMDHPTAEVIYSLVQREIPNISLGTVYRNLTSLVEQNQIIRFTLSDGKDHFDKTITKHFHLYCCNCEKVTDIKMDLDFEKVVWKEQKFQLNKITLVLEGICHQCQKNRKKEENE